MDLYCCTDIKYMPFLSSVLYYFLVWVLDDTPSCPLLDDQELRHLLDGPEGARVGCPTRLGAKTQSLKEHSREAVSGVETENKITQNYPAGLSIRRTHQRKKILSMGGKPGVSKGLEVEGQWSLSCESGSSSFMWAPCHFWGLQRVTIKSNIWTWPTIKWLKQY